MLQQSAQQSPSGSGVNTTTLLLKIPRKKSNKTHQTEAEQLQLCTSLLIGYSLHAVPDHFSPFCCAAKQFVPDIHAAGFADGPLKGHQIQPFHATRA